MHGKMRAAFPLEKVSSHSSALPSCCCFCCCCCCCFSCVQCFHVSVILRTLTWTTGSLMCVRNHSCACVYTREVGHIDNESAQHLDSEKLSQLFLVLRTGFEPLVLGTQVDALAIEEEGEKKEGGRGEREV